MSYYVHPIQLLSTYEDKSALTTLNLSILLNIMLLEATILIQSWHRRENLSSLH